MKPDRSVTPEVAAVGLIPISGNVIPHEWYKHVKRNGRVQANALIILADVVYWHRPTEILSDSNRPVQHQRKFHGDMLQANLSYYQDKFGLSKEQVREAMRCLKDDVGVIYTEVRQEPEHGRFNVPYIGIHPDRLWEITVPADLRDECPFEWVRKAKADAPPLCDTSQRVCDTSQRVCDVSHTNTKITTQNTTENTNGDHNVRRHPAEGGLEELVKTTPQKLLLQGNGHQARALRLQIEQRTLSDDDGMPLTMLGTLTDALIDIHRNRALIDAGDDNELARMRDQARFLWRMSEKYRTADALKSLHEIWKARHPTWKLSGRQFTQFAAQILEENQAEFGDDHDNATGSTNSDDYTAMARIRERAIIDALETTHARTNGTSPA